MAIGLDLGSSSIKAVRVGSGGRVVSIARLPVAARRGGGGRVEHDAWSILEAARAALASAAAGAGGPLGLATQRSTVLFWDPATGRPLTPAYSWQDLRGRALCDGLRRREAGSARADRGLTGPSIVDHTGLRLSPHYPASKLAWALRRVPGLRRKVGAGKALWGTLGAFVVWHLSGGSLDLLDHANAQRTLLFDLESLDWDPALFRLFGLDALLDAPARPALVPTFPPAGLVLDAPGGRLRLGTITGDQQAAMLGLGCRRPGDVAINYGSGAFVLRHVGSVRERTPGLLTTLLASWPVGAGRAARARPRSSEAAFALEGTVNAAGTALEWARRRLGLRVADEDLDRWLGRDVARRRGVHFLPAVAGLGAPRWDASARPRFAGDVRGASPRDLLRAVVESIACRCAEILRVADRGRGGRAAGGPVLVAGGLTRCRTLLQAQADLLQRPLLLRDAVEASALGAALLARSAPGGGIPVGVAAGGRLILPRISRDEAEARFEAWENAVYGSEGRRARGRRGGP